MDMLKLRKKMYNNLISLKAFLFVGGRTFYRGETRVCRTIRGSRCLVWITHVNKPDSPCTYVDNLVQIHPALTFENLTRLGRCKMEHGDVRKEYSVIFELYK